MNQLPLNKNELPLLREMLTKYKQGYISGLIPGSNITFTPSGCRNKIVSSTGGGGEGGASFIPNGVKIITESRELQADDAGYFLVLIPEIPETDVILTIPEISPIPVGGVFVVVNQMDESGKNNGIINTTTEGAVLKLGAGETLVYTVTNPNICIPISTIEKSNDAGEYKTALRYLMDNVVKSGNATLSSGTVTVNNSAIRTGAKIIISVDTPSGTQGFLSAPVASIVDKTSFVINSTSATENSTVNYYFVNP